MKKLFRYLGFAFTGLSCLLISANASFGWGVWGHQHINHAAVFALPQPMRGFFYDHIDFITIEASIPDVRKYTIHDTKEGPRHYIDLEAYGRDPLATLPHAWKDALKKYGEDTLVKNGILPWYVNEMLQKLTDAFREKDKARILFLAADLAHYLGDANMPLHTSLNHDGQLTGQRGVHALWESLLPELFGNSYNFHTPPAHLLEHPDEEIWQILRESHSKVDTLLRKEKALLDSWPREKIYETDSAGNILRNKFGATRFTLGFATAFHQALNGMVEQQMRKAIQDVSNYWYTAWVNAGKPDLSALDDAYTIQKNRKGLAKEYHLWEKGKVTGIKSDLEF